MRRILIGAAAMLILVPTACGHEHTSRTDGPLSETYVSPVKRYESLSDLRRDSTAVVRVTAGSAKADNLNDVPITIADVHVDRVIAGTVPSTVFPVQQLGGAGVLSPDTSRLVVRGRQYILFVEPFQLTPGVDTGRFVIIGDQGAYEVENDDEYTLVGAPGSALPHHISPIQLMDAMKGDNS